MKKNNILSRPIPASTIFSLIDVFRFVWKKPTQSIIFLLLTVSFLRVTSEKDSLSEQKKSSILNDDFNSLVSSMSSNVNEKISVMMHEAIVNNDFQRIDEVLNRNLNVFPNDKFLLQQNIRSFIYQTFKTFENFDNLKKMPKMFDVIMPYLNSMLSLDENNELAIALLYEVNFLTGNTKQTSELCEKLKKLPNVEYSFTHYVRGRYYRHFSHHHRNPKTINNAIAELEDALEKEKESAPARAAYQTFLEQCRKELNQILAQTTIFEFNQPGQSYYFLLDAKSGNAFYQNQGNIFDHATIKKACSAHFPLILTNDTALPDIPPIKRKEYQYRNYVLFYYHEYYYLYTAGIDSDYRISLLAADDYRFPQGKIGDKFLERSVAGILSSEGVIFTTAEEVNQALSKPKKLPSGGTAYYSSSKLRYSPNKEEATRSFLMSFLLILPLLYVSYKLFNKMIAGLNSLYKRYFEKNKLEIDLIKDLHSRLIASNAPLFSDQGFEMVENMIVLNSNQARDKIQLQETTLASKYPQLEKISISKDRIPDQWYNKLIKGFAVKKIKEEQKRIFLKFDHNLLPRGAGLKTHLDAMTAELMKDLIEQSPEYRVDSLLKVVKELNSKLSARKNNYFEQLNKDSKQITLLRSNAISYKNKYVSDDNIVFKSDDIIKNCNILIDLGTDDSCSLKIEYQALHEKLDSYQAKLELLQDNINSYNDALSEIEETNRQYTETKKSADQLFSQFQGFEKKYHDLYESSQSLSIHIEKLAKKSTPKIGNFLKVSQSKKENESYKATETPEQKAERIARFKAMKAEDKAERERGKQEEEESLQKKQKTDKNIVAMVEKSKEIERLKADTRLNTLKYHLGILSSGLELNANPFTHELLKQCSGKEVLYNKIIKEQYYQIYSYYSFLVALLRASHCLGQMTGAYSKYYLINFPSYLIRNVLMHSFFQKELSNLPQLIEASQEFIDTFGGLIKRLHKEGFPDQRQELKFESELFQEEILKKYEQRKWERSEIIELIKLVFRDIVIINELTTYLHDKHLEFYLSKKCHFLHQSIVGCFTLLGELLNSLEKVDKVASGNLFNLMFKNDLTYKAKGKMISYFKAIREQIGHHYLEQEEKDNILFPLNYKEYEILEDFKPILLAHLCKKTAAISDDINKLLKSDLVKGSKSGEKSKKEKDNNDEEKKPSLSR